MDILSSSIFLQGVDQKILPCGQGRIDSVKINPSLMMRECLVHHCMAYRIVWLTVILPTVRHTVVWYRIVWPLAAMGTTTTVPSIPQAYRQLR